MSFKVCDLGSKRGSVSKKLLDLTNAYLAIEALLKSRILSKKTQNQLQRTLYYLNEESVVLIREHAENEALQKEKIAS
jgi:hypothetical protein